MSARHGRSSTLGLLRLLGHQDWLPFGLRIRLVRAVAAPSTFEPTATPVAFMGVRYRCDLSSFLDWNIYFFGHYEKHILLLLRDIVSSRSGAVFVDVGANVGIHTLFMAKHCARVHAIEPYEPVRVKLQENVRDNQFTNVVVHPVGLGASEERLPFYAPRGANRGTGSFVDGHAPDNNAPFAPLPVKVGDELFRSIGLERLDAVKIDVEGFERSVLAGMSATLKRFRPAVVMELSPSTRRHIRTVQELLRLLPRGYRIHVIEPATSKLGWSKGSSYRLGPLVFPRERQCDLLLWPEECTLPGS